MSFTTRPLALSIAAFATIGLTLTGCSDDDEKAADNEAKACVAIADFQDAVSEISGLTAASTLEEIREVREGVREAYEDLAEKMDDVAGDREAALKSSYDSFNDAVDDLPDDATLPEAIASLQEESAAIDAAQVAVADDLSCD
ncbi:hypothetical protein NODU109028_06565 [Nocardioides dubius]|uniref:Uncharacterized protein n=1 Tax=Nocardioides dubius TaxID=317019 RepID=A0ABP4E7C6_9ACTN